ncbi:MAG: amidase [Acidobacteriota bacterium]|nr:amidase [Acidobacteriota bacterium]
MRSLSLLFLTLALHLHAWQETPPSKTFSPGELAGAEKVLGLSFTESERDLMQKNLTDALESYRLIRDYTLDNGVPPSLVFSPLPPGFKMPDDHRAPRYVPLGEVVKPDDPAQLAFMTVPQLAELLRSGQVTSEGLTRLYLHRLEKHGPTLQCVVTLLKDSALERARQMDREIARGMYRGPLHGIPYGIKDLFAVKGAKTTWGAEPYKDQVLDMDATVARKLEEAGAVLVAKLTLGALAWGDVWYGGKTRNPWNLEQGSSGSSAGSASATAAGLVGFSIGTETWGSIVSPSTRCGTTGLRPTFGAVSRHGAMALSWSMDKVGPICRSVDGAAMVFDAIRGSDGKDTHVTDAPFPYRPAWTKLSELRIGYLKSAFERDYPDKQNDQRTLDKLRELGARLEPIELPDIPFPALSIILSVEAAAAFDHLTTSNTDDKMKRQIANAWPNVFRAARHIPAVEYINANRIRTRLIEEMDKLMQTYDIYITPTFGGNNLLLTNLTGHPCVVVPNGFQGDETKTPTSITFMGRLFDEATLLGAVRIWQEATDFHKQYPPAFR